jgi:MFS transporter, Spinster family, sphingosine-1-phosphate transporter
MESTSGDKTYQVSKGAGVGLLIVLCLLQLSDWADRSILSISLQAIKDSFNLTDAQAGLLPSLLQFGIAIMTVPAAMLADRFARRKIIMAMSLIWSVFTLTTGLAQQVWHMFVSRFMVGAGEAGYQPAGQTWVGVAFRKEIRSRVMAIFLMCQPLGIALGLFLGGLVLTATKDWRPAFFIFGVPGIVLSFLILFMPDYKAVKQPGEAALSKAYFKGWGDLFKIKSYWLYIIGSTFMYFIAFAGPSWVPTLLMRSYNMEAAAAGTAIAGVSLLMFLAPVGGILADKWQKRSPIGRPLFTIVMIVLLLVGDLAAMLTVGTLPFGLWMGIYMFVMLCNAFVLPSLITLPHDFVPVGIRSTAIGIQTLVAQMLGGMLGPVFVGAVSDALGGGAHGIQWGLIWTVPIAALSIIFILIMTRYYKADSSGISDTVLAER